MRNFLIVLLLIASTIAIAQNQAVVKYSVLFNKSLATEELREFNQAAFERQQLKEAKAKELEFFLEINGNKSIFYLSKIDENDPPLVFVRDATDGQHKFYVDSKNEILIDYFSYWGTLINIETKTNEIPWKLSSESKKIDKFTCFKATKKFTVRQGGFVRDMSVEAWYAPEIPLKFGPKRYSGLPGLIIELKENHLTYYLNNIDFKPSKEINIIKPQGGRILTKKEFESESLEIKNLAKQAIMNSKG